jgi:hypothetical protein
VVDTNFSQSFVYNVFKGLNYRDDEDQLELGKTPKARNFEITAQYGLANRKGIKELIRIVNTYTLSTAIEYTDLFGNSFYLGVGYPFILLISKATGSVQIIYSNLTGEGEPYIIKGIVGDAMVVDGANSPVYIQNGVASAVSWPPAYTSQNSVILNESPMTTQPNPTTLGGDVAYPSFGVFYEGRYYLAGDRLQPFRLYASKLRSGTDFSNNTALERGIPFFGDIVTNSPIVGLVNLSDKFMVILCETELHQLTGVFPPGGFVAEPKVRTRPLNRTIGCISRNGFAQKGNTDLFFLSDKKTLYALSLSENFQDARPLGLSEIIFPAFENLTINQLRKSILVNHEIKGELQIYYPSEEERYYADERLVYNYSESNTDPEWSYDNKLNLSIINAFVDKESQELVLVTKDGFYLSDSGTNYNGEPINFFYQLSTLDFGDKDKQKDILEVEIGYRLTDADTATLFFSHLWEHGGSAIKEITLTKKEQATYGSSIYGDAVYSSDAGKPLAFERFQINEPIGRILKVAIRSTSECNLFIAYIKFRYRLMGSQ